MEKLKEKLEEMYQNLMNRDNEILVLADEEGDSELLEVMASHLVQMASILRAAYNYCEHHDELKVFDHKKEMKPESLDELVEFANILDSSGNQELQKKADVIDQLLLNLGKTKTSTEVFKEAQDAEVNKIKEQREKSLDRSYNYPNEEHNKELKAEEVNKSIKSSIKEYRPLETSLSTRYCPDHPGTSVHRIGDDVYQCALDKKIYDYNEGFTTMKGNKVPGTSVENQTQSLNDRTLEQMHFSTRESRLQE